MTTVRPRLLAALLALSAIISVLNAPARAAEATRPTETESRAFQAILARLQSPENAAQMPTPVTDVVRSLDETIKKSFSGKDGRRSVYVTIKVRTRHIHWDPNYRGDAEWRGDNKVVGRYGWHVETRTRQTRTRRDITLTANNTIMLDDRHMAQSERDTLGRIANESLLYHEFLHGQLLMNAMDDPAWRARFIQTGQVDITGSDSEHRWIYDLQARYLLGRGGRYAYTVPAGGDGAAGNGTFTLKIGRTPSGYVGDVAGEFQSLVHGNVESMRITVENRGARRGEVSLHGQLTDPSRGGFFLAVVDPVVRTTAPPPAQ